MGDGGVHVVVAQKKAHISERSEKRIKRSYFSEGVILLQLFQIPNPGRDMSFMPFLGQKSENSKKLKKLDSHYFQFYRESHFNFFKILLPAEIQCLP